MDHKDQEVTSEIKTIIADYMRNVLELDDQETIDDFTDCYLNLIAELVPQMRPALEHKNFKELRTLAHTLKGSSANIGVETIRAISLQLQEAADAQNETLCTPLVGQLETYKKNLCE